MPTGIYDHSNNPGFTGKKHDANTRARMSEGQKVAQKARREREKYVSQQKP